MYSLSFLRKPGQKNKSTGILPCRSFQICNSKTKSSILMEMLRSSTPPPHQNPTKMPLRIYSTRSVYFTDFCQKNCTSWKWQAGTTHHTANSAVLETKFQCRQVMPTRKAFVLVLLKLQTQTMHFFWQKDYFWFSKRGLSWPRCSNFQVKAVQKALIPRFSNYLESQLQYQLTIHTLICLKDF